jgi:hypothetical protein
MDKREQALKIFKDCEAFVGRKLTLDEMEDTLLDQTDWSAETITQTLMSLDYPAEGFGGNMR